MSEFDIDQVVQADFSIDSALDVQVGTFEGGAGGHTIVDDAGTSLTQRTNLQFKGAYSEDNATDDTTEVNVVREMTKAEFDLLSADEKTGFINITDITGGNDDRFQPVIYSIEEREIGVWEDGKPLYQKTIIITNASKNASYDLGITNFDTCFVYDGSFGSGIVPYLHGQLPAYSVGCFLDKTGSSLALAFRCGEQVPATIDGFITLRYTKTTDTAGSGQWTPQGVPTHHYSEDEQIIGTWIDGKPLYERVIDLGADTNISYDSWTLTTVSLSEIDRLVLVQGLNSTGAAYYGDLYGGNNNGYLQLLTGRNGTYVSVRYLIFRYTKSST